MIRNIGDTYLLRHLLTFISGHCEYFTSPAFCLSDPSPHLYGSILSPTTAPLPPVEVNTILNSTILKIFIYHLVKVAQALPRPSGEDENQFET